MNKMQKKRRIETNRRFSPCDICEFYFVDPGDDPCGRCQRTRFPKTFAKEVYINDVKYVLAEGDEDNE